jgi:hypothetical protein
VNPVLGLTGRKEKEEDLGLKASLDYVNRPYLKRKKKEHLQLQPKKRRFFFFFPPKYN